ncbi:MAG TPA: hypothetical protein VEP28_03055 [Rubrobacter sp.]|nr:hypothetical protein [Rubrobacter sp.]
MSINREALLGEWVHSYEEDVPGRRIFRRGGYSFPPARGRDAVELKGDGSAVMREPGPSDMPEGRTGTWALEHETVRIDVGDETTAMEVVSCDEDRLEVRE